MKIARLALPLALILSVALLGCSSGDSASITRHGLTVNFEGMNPHVGDALELRVVHVQTDIEIAYTAVDPITMANFAVAIPDILVAGETYHVDFYADYNRNRRYDAPSTDHAWRRVVNVTGPTSLTFVHDTNFTPINFPSRL